MPRPTPFSRALAPLTLAAAIAFVPTAWGQDDPAPEPTPDTPAGAPEADAPQPEKTPDDKTDDEQPPEDAPEEQPEAEMKDDAEKGSDAEAEGEPAEEKKEITPEVVVTNLETPTGLAVAPQSGDVLIAHRFGIYRYVPQQHAIFIEVEGYEADTMGDPGLPVGPLSLDFYGDSELVVGNGSQPAGEEIVSTYEIGLEPRGDDPQIQDTDAKQTAGPVDGDTAGGEGADNFTGVLVGDAFIYVSTSASTPKGWILKIPAEKGKFGDIEPGIATADVAGVGGPGPIIADENENLVVGLWGGPDRGDDMIAVFSPKTGELVKKYDVDIAEFGGMAYSPKTDKLYVTDMGLTATGGKGGLYEVAFDGDEAKVTEVLGGLDKPAGLAFTADGKLYLTTVGTPEEGKKDSAGDPFSPGKLHLIDAGL